MMSIATKLLKVFDPEIVAKNLKELRYRTLARYWLLARPEMPDPVFILGCSRAGTTVTFQTIRQTPHLLSFPYEIPQFWHSLWGPRNNNFESDAAGAEQALPSHRNRAFAHFYARLGKGRVLDKTCINILRIPYLYKLFPRAHFIYIHRDGRDNISSLMEGWRQRGRFDLKQYIGELPTAVEINDGEFNDWCFFLPPEWRAYNRDSLEDVCAYQWITANTLALEASQFIPEQQWIALRYEDIFERPVEMFRTVFERLDIPFTDKLRAHCTSLDEKPTSLVKGPPQKQKWHSQNPQAIEKILPKIRPLMIDLGYDPDS